MRFYFIYVVIFVSWRKCIRKIKKKNLTSHWVICQKEPEQILHITVKVSNQESKKKNCQNIINNIVRTRLSFYTKQLPYDYYKYMLD